METVKIKSFLKDVELYDFSLKIYGALLSIRSRSRWKDLAKNQELYLELGSCKRNEQIGWVTVDLKGADIDHDLSRGIPLPDGCVDKIYTSHLFEHMSYSSLINLIQECYRVLKDKGELSVCVPDAEKYIRAYALGEVFGRESRDGPFYVETGSLIDQVNHVAYMGGHHKYMFDSVNLLRVLETSPFGSVIIRDFDEALDLNQRKYESIYASAYK